MRKEQVLINDQGVIRRATVTWYDDWFDEFKKNEPCKILELEFDEDETPENLIPEQIEKIYEEGRDKFREKFGIDIEDYFLIGSPSYSAIGCSDIKKGIKEYCLRELFLGDSEYKDDFIQICNKYGWIGKD